MLKKRKNYIALSVVCMLTLSACTSDEVQTVPDIQSKTPIELTVGIVGDNPNNTRSATRNVVTTDAPYGQSAQAFAAATNLYMVMKSDKADGSETKYARSMGSVDPNTLPATNVSFSTDYDRFWEDSYSRDSKISVFSACVPGKSTALNIGGATAYNSNTWTTSSITTTIAWPLSGTSASQDAAFLENQDLCFSNNVSKYTISETETDNRIKFNTGTKKFETGNMIFYHALTKVTFKIKKGNGFGSGTDVFKFTASGKNIELKGFNTSGTFDITNGEFKTSDPAIGTGDINNLADTKNPTTDAAYEHVLTCLMLPGSALTSTATDEINFEIDHNVYHITKAQLATALSGKKLSDNSTDALTGDSKMRPGVHYIFELTVGKKMIDNLTAKVVDWEEVTADETTPTNAKIVVSLLNNGTPKTGDADFDLFRSTNESGTIDNSFASYAWATGYAPVSTPNVNKARLVENTTNSGVYTAEEALDPHTAWYWPNNKTFYHFRTVYPKTNETWKVTEDGTNGDYITLTRAATGWDVCWGAPFNQTASKLTYDWESNGFDGKGTNHQISKAIGPTTGTINMEMFHMMSDVTIQLTTPQSGDADYDARVDLTGATLKFTNTYPTGKVLMGNGIVIPTGTVGDVTETVSASYKLENYGFVPQSLENVVLTITTTDHNQYEVILKDLEVGSASITNNLIANPYTETSTGSGKYKIDRWYPNFRYTYTFKLKKSDIARITATLADWENVEAGDDNVQIK